MNTITVVGNVGQDPESRYTPDGTLVVNISVADEQFAKNEKFAQWFKCSIFGNRGEAIAKYVKKGTRVVITGQLTITPYTDAQGYERTSNQIRVDRFSFASNRNDANGNHDDDNDGYQQQRPAPRQQQRPNPRPAPQRQELPPQRPPQRQPQRQAAPIVAQNEGFDDWNDDEATEGRKTVPF